MADIGAILLPDPNLMESYQRSFDKQMALKQYVAQDSRQQQQQVAKEIMFVPDAGLQAYKGQSNAMMQKVQAYQQKAQALLADRSRGVFFQLDPKAQAELATEKYSLMQDQAIRLNAITKLNSALPIIRKPGFSSVYNTKYTEDWMAKFNKGEMPDGEPIQALPKNTGLVVDDIFAKVKPETIYSNPVKNGHIVSGTQTSYIPDIAGKEFNPKTYKTQGYEWLHNQVKNNPATQQILDDNFDLFTQNNPKEAEQLIVDHGKDASYALFTAQNKDKIEAKMLGNTEKTKPKYIEGAQGKDAKILVPENGVVDLVDKNITSTIPSGVNGNEISEVKLEKVDFNTGKAYAIKTTPGNSLYGIAKKTESVPFDFGKAVKILKSQGYPIPEIKQGEVKKSMKIAGIPSKTIK